METRAGGPHLSLVIPCYNEEEIVEATVSRLVQAFDKAGYSLEVVAVDNGSQDATGRIIQAMAAQGGGSVVHHRVEVNRGYGHGILSGMSRCSAPWVGMIPADGQVDAEDVVRLYEAAITARGPVLAKARRRYRLDGVRRKIISTTYNWFVRLLWPSLESWDVNGSPKLMPRAAFGAMELDSNGWFLDPEIMIKAHYLGMRIVELNVFARMRGAGLSHVRATTCIEFFTNLLKFRFSGSLHDWRARASRIDLRAQAATQRTPAGVLAE